MTKSTLSFAVIGYTVLSKKKQQKKIVEKSFYLYFCSWNRITKFGKLNTYQLPSKLPLLKSGPRLRVFLLESSGYLQVTALKSWSTGVYTCVMRFFFYPSPISIFSSLFHYSLSHNSNNCSIDSTLHKLPSPGKLVLNFEFFT